MLCYVICFIPFYSFYSALFYFIPFHSVLFHSILLYFISLQFISSFTLLLAPSATLYHHLLCRIMCGTVTAINITAVFALHSNGR